MKKHDDGYVMVLVLVVILVLSIVSAALMSLGVTNTKSQRASIDRMQDKYSAQGEMEKLVAKLEQELSNVPTEEIEVTVQETGTESSEDSSDNKFRKVAAAKWLTSAGLTEYEDLVVSMDEDENIIFRCNVEISATSESGKTQVISELTLHCKMLESESEGSEKADGEEADPANDNPGTVSLTKEYRIVFDKLEYKSYQILTGGGG